MRTWINVSTGALVADGLQLADEFRCRTVNAHLNELVHRDIVVAFGLELAHELGRHPVDARLDELVGVEVLVAERPSSATCSGETL